MKNCNLIKKLLCLMLCMLLIIPVGIFNSSAAVLPAIDPNCKVSPDGQHSFSGNICDYCRYHINHTWEYKVIEDEYRICATCIGEGNCYLNKDGGDIVIAPPADTACTGMPIGIEIQDNLSVIDDYEVLYYAQGDDTHTSVNPIMPGKYVGEVAIGGVSVGVEYELLAPFTIATQPQSSTVYYGDASGTYLSVDSIVSDIKYTWYVDGNHADELDGSTVFQKELPLGIHQVYCNVSYCDYSVNTNTVQLTVESKPLATSQYTVSLNQNEFFYRDAPIEPEVTVSSDVIDLKLNVDYTISYRNNVNAGTGYVDINFMGNYSGYYYVPFRIKPAPVTVTAQDAEMVLGGEEPELTCTIEGLQGDDTLTVRLSRLASGVIGNFPIYGSFTPDPNYQITFIKGNFKLKPDTSILTEVDKTNVTEDNLQDLIFLNNQITYAADDAKEEWQYVADACNELIAVIDDVKAKIKDIDGGMSGLRQAEEPAEADVNAVLEKINRLLETQNLSSYQSEHLDNCKTECEIMIEVINAVIGDINDNGRIDARDYLLLKRAYFNTYHLDARARAAGDINGNKSIDARDYFLLKRAFFGTYEIK